MSRQMLPFFQTARPVFVKIGGFHAAGKVWKQGERFNWEFYGVPYDTIQILFLQDYLYHDPNLEEEVAKKVTIGDGLEELSIDELQTIVANINAKVKAKTKTTDEFFTKKCKESKIKDKQIGLIRRWRTSFGHLE